jgi:hypothetical protein
MRCSTVSPFASVAPVAHASAGLCGSAWASWIAGLVAVSARAAKSGLASIVAPINAAIAAERIKRADRLIGWLTDDIAVSFLDSAARLQAQLFRIVHLARP